MKVVWTRAAADHLEEIGDWIARDSPAAAERLVAAIIDRVSTLGSHPHLGRPGRIVETRELVIAGTPYIVAYRVRESAVEVLAAFHGARRWPERLEEDERGGRT